MQLKNKMAAILATGLMLTTLSTVAAQANHGEKIEICHATGSETNPFVLIEVSEHGLNGHGNHEDDIIPAPDNGICTGETPTTPDEVVICHRDDDDEPFEQIVVEEGPELQAHLDHGDTFPNEDGECPPVEDDEDPDEDGDEDDDNGCSNSGNVGINLGLCRLAAPISLINILGSNEQSAVIGGDSECENEDNVGINLGLCSIAVPISGINVLGSNVQNAIVP